LSYQAPHEIIRTNEILVRAHSRNATSDLKTIERLIKRRDEITKNFLGYEPRCNHKYLGTEGEQFESVVMHPNFAPEPIIFFNKDTDNWLHKLTQNVMVSWHERRPSPHRLKLLRLTPNGKIKGFCEISDNGHVVFQQPAEISDDAISVVSSMIFLTDVLGTDSACILKRFLTPSINLLLFSELSISRARDLACSCLDPSSYLLFRHLLCFTLLFKFPFYEIQ